jgi:hypothetical protein
MATTFSNKTELLGILFIEYASDDHFKEWSEFHDVGLPLSYLVSKGFSIATETGIKSIDETWNSFLDLVGIKDTGFDQLDDIFTAGEIVISQ